VTGETDACILGSAIILSGRIILLVKVVEMYTTYTQSVERSPPWIDALTTSSRQRISRMPLKHNHSRNTSLCND